MVRNASAFLGNLLEELRAKGFDAILEAAESDPALKEKICLVGEAVLYGAKRDPAVMEKLYVFLDRSLTKKEDRTLFGLPPRTPSASLDGPVVAPQEDA